jgi:two-component system, sensor histidine kinase PdtaS
MGQVRRVPPWSYIFAVLTVAAAVLVTWLLPPLYEHTPLALLFAAVAVSAWYGGLGPGVLATVVGALTLRSVVLPPTSSLIVDSWDDVAILGIFALVALLISSLHAARRRAEVSRREQERTTELEHAIGALRAEIAERVRAEAVVQESEERYRQMFERNHAVKLLIDPDSGAIVDANPAAAEFYGYAPEELRRLKITDLNLLPPGQVAAEMGHALTEQRTYLLFRHRLASGAVRDVEVYSGPMQLHGRRLLYSIVHDITQRRQAEQALQQAKDDLEHKVAERTAELQALNVQLQGSLSEKEVLLREIHHRVKNNMQLISSLLSLQADLIDDPRLLAMFTDSQQRIQSMALVHDILYRSDDLARINLADYIRLLITELRLSYRVDPGLINVQMQLDEVFVGIDTVIPCGLLLHELISNCLKHAFASGDTGEIRVELLSQAARALALVVSDNGCGFPEELDFRRTDSLGLQLVCSLTEQLGGYIALERGHGTRFTITFPATSKHFPAERSP